MQRIHNGNTKVIQLSDILRENLKDKLADLAQHKPYAYVQLCAYCKTMRIERDAKKILMDEGGILDAKGDLPVITREAVYELTTGLSIYE